MDIFHEVGLHSGPPEVPPYKFDGFLLSKVSGHFAMVFRLETSWDHRLGNLEASSIVECIVRFHCQILRWIDIIRTIWVSDEGAQT